MNTHSSDSDPQCYTPSTSSVCPSSDKGSNSTTQKENRHE